MKIFEFAVSLIEGRPNAVAYCAPEMMAEGTSNLYLIAVHENFRGKGVGAAIMKQVENILRAKGVRILIVETSGLPAYKTILLTIFSFVLF